MVASFRACYAWRLLGRPRQQPDAGPVAERLQQLQPAAVERQLVVVAAVVVGLVVAVVVVGLAVVEAGASRVLSRPICGLGLRAFSPALTQEPA